MPESQSPPEPVATRYKYRFCIETTSACPNPIRPADPGRRLPHFTHSGFNFFFYGASNGEANLSPPPTYKKANLSPRHIKKYLN